MCAQTFSYKAQPSGLRTERHQAVPVVISGACSEYRDGVEPGVAPEP